MQDKLANATLGVTFFDDRRWASQERVKAEERAARMRLEKQKKLRDQAKRDRVNAAMKKRMGALKFYFCCCLRGPELQVMRAERLGRPDFDDPVRAAAFSRPTRFQAHAANLGVGSSFEGEDRGAQELREKMA